MNYRMLSKVTLVGAISAVSALAYPLKGLAATPSILYDTQVQKLGWQKSPNDSSTWFRDGQEAGTNGKSLRMESIKIALKLPSGMSGGVIYDAHVQNIGWQNAANPYKQYAPIQTIKPEAQWFKDGATAGTVGRSLRMEAFTIKLTGEIAKHYDVVYDSHVQNIGWQYANYGLYYQAPNFETMAPVANWFKNGAEVGTNGRALRMEALAIKLLAKPVTSTTKNVTLNKDDKGNSLTSTSGYTKLSSATKSTTTTDVYGDKTITNTTTVIWHKPVITTKTVTVNKDDKGNTLSSTSGYTKLSSASSSKTSAVASNGDKTVTNTTTVIWHKPVTTSKNVTVNKDDKGNTLSSTSGYVKLSSSISSSTGTASNGDKIITNTTTVIWHKPVTTTKTITVNKDDKGNTLSSTSGYVKLSSSTSSNTVTASNGDKTITNTTTVIWHKPVTTTKTVTVNKDKAGKLLSSTSGYAQLSSSTASSTSTASNGDKTVTTTTTITWAPANPSNILKLPAGYLAGLSAPSSSFASLALQGKSLNTFVASYADETTKVNLFALTAAQQQALSQWLADLLNPVRTTAGMGNLVVSQAALNFTNDVVNRYNNDNWNMLETNWHDVAAINNAAIAHGLLSSGYTDEQVANGPVSVAYGQYYEDAAAGYINTSDTTMAELKSDIYASIIDMLFDDAECSWGHAQSLTGILLGKNEVCYFGVGIDKYAQNHMEIIPNDSLYIPNPSKFQ